MKFTMTLVASLLIILLTSCGGGGGGSAFNTGVGGSGNNPPPPPLPPAGFNTGVGGSGVAIGAIQGFGSVFVNDREMDTDDAIVIVEGVEGASGDISALKIGQQLAVVGDIPSLDAAEVRYRSNIKGPVTTINSVDPLTGVGSFVVFGQAVTSNARTRFFGVSIADILVNDLLEISGVLDDAGILVATFVELKSALAEYKVTGTTANTTATTFTLNGLTVDYTSATLAEFQGAAVADGQIVEVKADPADFVAPGSVTASEVELLPVLELNETAEVELEGFIDRFNSTTDFDVAGLTVSANAQTTFENGSAASLVLGVKLEVEGTVDANGILQASRIKIELTNAARIEANIEAIDVAAQTITALGVTFEVESFTELEDNSSLGLDPLTFADLAIGDEIEMRGFVDGSRLIATEVEREDPDPRARLRGPVTAETEPGGSTTGTFDVFTVTVTGDSSVTEYQDESDVTITQAAFHNAVNIGTFIEARWDVFSSTTLITDQLSLEDDED